jgi:hypothetical protein
MKESDMMPVSIGMIPESYDFGSYIIGKNQNLKIMIPPKLCFPKGSHEIENQILHGPFGI